MQHISSFDYFGSTIQAESLGAGFVPRLEETITSHCVPLTNDGKIIAVNVIGRGLDIPGGHIDGQETAIQAMQREALEEAQIIVQDPVLIDVWRLSSKDTKLGLSEKPYLALYAANVKSILEFVANTETDERLVLEPEEFILKYFGDKGQARIMAEQTLAALR